METLRTPEDALAFMKSSLPRRKELSNAELTTPGKIILPCGGITVGWVFETEGDFIVLDEETEKVFSHVNVSSNELRFSPLMPNCQTTVGNKTYLWNKENQELSIS